MPVDVLARQRANIPAGAEQLTEQEQQREVANCYLFGFMDLLCIVGMIVVLCKKEQCQKHFKVWYICNAIWATISICFLYWFKVYEISKGFQTKRSVVFTYVLEFGYIALSFAAWGMLTSADANNECQQDAPSLIELMVDMIILIYMRSLRLMSIMVFVIICGLPLLYCYLKHRPRPTQDPVKLKLNLNKVTLGSLI